MCFFSSTFPPSLLIFVPLEADIYAVHQWVHNIPQLGLVNRKHQQEVWGLRERGWDIYYPGFSHLPFGLLLSSDCFYLPKTTAVVGRSSLLLFNSLWVLGLIPSLYFFSLWVIMAFFCSWVKVLHFFFLISLNNVISFVNSPFTKYFSN